MDPNFTFMVITLAGIFFCLVLFFAYLGYRLIPIFVSDVR